MKKIFAFGMFFFLVSCLDAAIEKPSNLIDESVMENILYDLSLLDAIQSQNPYSADNKMMNPKAYIYKKYKIDSVQFTQSNRYYVSQIEQYKKMYENVSARIEREKKEADSLLTINGNKPPIISGSDAGQVQ
jgi:hypothetical protein